MGARIPYGPLEEREALVVESAPKVSKEKATLHCSSTIWPLCYTV